MAGAQLGADILVAGKGQDAAGGVNLALPDNHAPIVEGRLVEEDIGDKLGGGRCLDDGTGGHNLAQLGLTLKDDQRAHAQLLEDLGGVHHALDGLAGLRFALFLIFGRNGVCQGLDHLAVAHLLQGLADFRLEQNDHDDNARGQERPQNGVEHKQIQLIGN